MRIGRVCVLEVDGKPDREGSSHGRRYGRAAQRDEATLRLRRLPWELEGEEIVREWRFEDFNAAIAFVGRVAEVAEKTNHHPDILVHGWNKVKLSLTDPSAGGLTETDFEMAKRFDELD